MGHNLKGELVVFLVSFLGDVIPNEVVSFELKRQVSSGVIKLKDEGKVSCESELYDGGKRKIDAMNLSGRRVIDLL